MPLMCHDGRTLFSSVNVASDGIVPSCAPLHEKQSAQTREREREREHAGRGSSTFCESQSSVRANFNQQHDARHRDDIMLMETKEKKKTKS